MSFAFAMCMTFFACRNERRPHFLRDKRELKCYFLSFFVQLHRLLDALVLEFACITVLMPVFIAENWV